MKAEEVYSISLNDLQEMYDECLDSTYEPFQLGTEVITLSEAFKRIHPAVYDDQFDDWLQDKLMTGEIRHDVYNDRFIG